MLVTYKSVLVCENMHTEIFRVDWALCLQPALRGQEKADGCGWVGVWGWYIGNEYALR